MSGTVWLLLWAGEGCGQAIPLSAGLSTGVHGEGVRRVELAGGGAELQHSAGRAVTEAARILYREGYLDRQILVRFAADDLGNVQGRSAELAFALAVTAAAVERPLPPLAATGRVEGDGAIGPVEGVADKLAAALTVLPEGGRFVFPAANEREIPTRLRHHAATTGVILIPAHRLEDLLARLGLPITRTWLAEPFRGLEPFSFAHASIFFGRGAEVAELVALLARRPAVLVRGPSGAGKSSLVLAGVMPALLRRDNGGHGLRWGLFRPRDIAAEADPEREMAGLVRALAAAWCHDQEGGLGAAAAEGAPLTADPDAFAAWVRNYGAERAVWVVDQLEELFDPRLHPATVAALAGFLAGANRLGMVLLATITNAALAEPAKLPPLAACFGVEGQYVLEPRHDAALLEAVIHAPAAAAGLRFEAGLEAELLTAASHGGIDVLPLLELLLTELYERRDPATRELRLADYHRVGGLDGVISARAEAVHHDLGPAERDAVALLLWKLATAGMVETRDYPPDHPIHAVLAAYQARRLLVRDGQPGGGAVLRAAHDALLRHWSRAVEQRQAEAADLALWLDLGREARQSRCGERALIPPGPQLEAARSLRQRRRAWWTAADDAIVQYIEDSTRQHQRRRLLLGLGLGLPAAAATAWGGHSLWSIWRARSETHLDFADIAVPGPDYVVAAEPYLHRLGITVPERFPATARLVIRSNMGLYGGRAADPGASEHFLTEEIDDTTAPIGFTLAFATPPRRVGLFRATLWAATASGVTHPSWQAEALDTEGRVMETTGEGLLAAYTTIPGRLFVLGDGRNAPIAGLRIRSDYRAGGVPFAGFHAVLINELVLYS